MRRNRNRLECVELQKYLDQFRFRRLVGLFEFSMSTACGWIDAIVLLDEIFRGKTRRFRRWSESVGHGELPCR